MDVQLLVRFDEPEIAEAGGVSQAHTRGDLFPARIVSEVLVRSVLVRKNWIGAIARQRTVEIVLNGSVEAELARIDQLHHRVCKHRLGERRAVHDSVCVQRISAGVTDTVSLHIINLAVIDDRNGYAFGAGLGHDLAHFCVDRGTARYRLCDDREGEAEDNQKWKSSLSRCPSGSPRKT